MKMLGLCIVALAATLCSGYIPGREYHYHTEGKILQELDKQIHQHAGFMFKGDMILQAKEHGAIIKLVDTKFRLVNERPPEHEEDRVYVSSPFAKEYLAKPFEIRCKNGVVKEVKVEKDDSIWSVNLKKAIAAKFVMQTDYAEANILQEDTYKDDEFKLDRKNYYMTNEDGIHGECQVDYEVDDSHENVVKVTKIKNFDYCEKSTYRYYINRDQYIPLQSQSQVNAPVRRSEVSHYKLQGNRKKFVVEKMTSEERIVLSPYGHDAEFVKGDATVLIELKGSEDLKEAIQMPDDAVTHHDLHFQFQEPDEIKDVEDLKKEPHNIYHLADQKIPSENVAEHFNRIVNIRAADDELYTEVFKDKAMPILFMQLANALTGFNYEDLEKFYENYVAKEANVDPKELHQRRDLFVDALAFSGTSSSFMFLKHLIIDKQVSFFTLPHVLQQLPLTLKEFSPVLIEEFYTICTDPYVNDIPNTRKMCFLAFSKFVHDQCVAKYHNVYLMFNTTEKILCNPEIAEKYFQKIVARYEDHFEDSSEYSTFVKVAGNLATRGSMRYLVKLLHDFSHPTYYRFIAIKCLSTHTGIYYDEMVPLLMTIYFNTSEVHEIRIMALYHLMTDDVARHNLEAIADNLEHEPDHQVAHYTMTIFQKMVENKHPDFSRSFQLGKRILRYLKRVDFRTKFDLRHSFTVAREHFNEKWRIGGGKELNYITSSRSYVPRHIDFISYNFFGSILEGTFSMDYVGYGLDKYIDQIISFKKQKKSVFDVLRRKTRDVNIVEKELKEIKDKLHIHKRTSEPVYGDISIFAYNSEINFFHFNESTFQNLAKSADIVPVVLNALKDVGKISTKRFLSGKQYKFVAPSMLGVPLYIDISEAAFVYYNNNNMKMGLEPDIFAEGPKDDTPVTINFKIDGQLVKEEARIMHAGAVFPSIGIITGAGIMKRDYNSGPLKLKLSWDPDTPKLVLKHTTVSPHVRLHKSFLPFTMVYNMSKIGCDLQDGSLLPYARKKELKEFEMEAEFTGEKYRLNGTHGELHVLESVGSVTKFLTENSPKELIDYLAHNPLAVPYDVDYSLQGPEDEILVTMETFGYDNPPDKAYTPDFLTDKEAHTNYINAKGEQKTQTCLLKAERLSKGAFDHKVISEISYIRTFDDRYHMFNVFYDRSPASPNDHDSFKMCYSSSVLFPHVDAKKLYELDTVNMDPKIKVSADLAFGKNCENDKKIRLRGEMSRTEEHKQLQADRENPEVHCPRTNKDAYLYKKCKDNMAHGIHYSLNCRKYWSRSLKLRHYSIDIEHENLDSDTKSVLSTLESCWKNLLHYYVDEHRVSDIGQLPNKIHIEANFSAKTDHVDIQITKPNKIIKFNHVPHPRAIQAPIANPFFEFTNKMVKWSRYKFPFCSVEGDHVHTFDYAEYELPPIDCYKVLAKDCSEKELFTVLGKKITHNHFTKAVKIFIPNWKIEALPVSAESDILVRLNGQHIPVTEAEPHFHYETIKGKNVLMFSVSFNGLYYKIKSDHYGITVYYDGKAIIINLSPYYVGKQCGLCGEYNNNERLEEEFLGPRNCLYHNTTYFSYSYVIPEEDCNVPNVPVPGC